MAHLKFIFGEHVIGWRALFAAKPAFPALRYTKFQGNHRFFTPFGDVVLLNDPR